MTGPRPTKQDVLDHLDGVLQHGWGEIRVIVQDHHIETVYTTEVHKEAKALDKLETATLSL